MTELNNIQVTKKGVDAVVQANNAFAFELYSELSQSAGNVFISPWSIFSALAMTYEGAQVRTADEIQGVFHFPEKEVLRPSYAAIHALLDPEEALFKLHEANAIWPQKGYELLETYLDVIQKFYGGKVTNLDFVRQTEESRQIINAWVEQQTHDKITDLIPPGGVNAETRMVLTNAIYFKGQWMYKFEEKNTMEDDFRTGEGKTVRVPMMKQVKATLPYTQTEELQVLEMPYIGGTLSMIVMLPRSESMRSLEGIDASAFAELRQDLHEQELNVYMPRFKFKSNYQLRDVLANMGMHTAFSGRADFSGMDGGRNLYIDEVIHQAFVDVNEEGTEAAAATAVTLMRMAMPLPLEFRADHPFMFAIQEKQTGNILFLGGVYDPS